MGNRYFTHYFLTFFRIPVLIIILIWTFFLTRKSSGINTIVFEDDKTITFKTKKSNISVTLQELRFIYFKKKFRQSEAVRLISLNDKIHNEDLHTKNWDLDKIKSLLIEYGVEETKDYKEEDIGLLFDTRPRGDDLESGIDEIIDTVSGFSFTDRERLRKTKERTAHIDEIENVGTFEKVTSKYVLTPLLKFIYFIVASFVVFIISVLIFGIVTTYNSL